jgi:urocanate hydratase
VPQESPSESTLDSIVQVWQAYASLMQFAPAADDPNLGGKLLYAGELDAPHRALVAAANISGGATLTASDQPAALREGQREGAIDFIVNSLDEALRILKNEVRKHQPVAVAVSVPPIAIEAEMLERGVLPDLLPPQSDATPQPAAFAQFILQGAQQIRTQTAQAGQRLMVWTAPAEYAQNLAAFELLLLEQLPPSDCLNRRWLRLSPRYLGSSARRLRSIACDEPIATNLIAKLGRPSNH